MVQLDESLCEFESDKATLEFPAEAAGKLIHVAQEGDDIEIGAIVAKIDTDVAVANTSSSPASAPSAPATNNDPESEDNYAAGHPSPAAAKILAEKGINPADVKGTGRDGRITKADAEKAQKLAPKADKPCLLYTSPSPRDQRGSRMPSSA